MLKGCQRKIIMVKDLGSSYFESAYFVIKGDLPEIANDSDMLAEAHRIIADCSSQMEFTPTAKAEARPLNASHRKKASPTLAVLFAFLALIGVTALLVAIF